MSNLGTRRKNQISRSASLNDTRAQQSRVTQDLGGLSRTATDISFTSPDTISGTSFPAFTAGMNIIVVGSNLNDRIFKVLTASATTITVEPSQISTESAGSLIDIRTV